MKKQSAQGVGRAERLCRMLDISPVAIASGYSVEIEGRTRVRVSGGGRILLYTPEEIRIELPRDRFLSIKGKALSCASYNREMLGVEGYICSVEYGD